MWKKSTAGRRCFKIFIRLLKNAEQKFHEDEVFTGKRTCALRPAARMNNTQLLPVLTTLYRSCFKIICTLLIFPKGLLVCMWMSLTEMSKQFCRLSFCVEDKCKAGIRDSYKTQKSLQQRLAQVTQISTCIIPT